MVLEQFERDWPQWVEELKTLVRIPSISFPGYPKEPVHQSAAAIAELCKRAGLKTEIVEFAGAFPYVIAELIHDPALPTVLLYAHHDVQPPGDESIWETPPFEPVEKDGPGGARLYGRGSADDKAGAIIHLAAIESFLKSGEKLPVNVKMVIEGEEEIGSGHLFEFLEKYHERLMSDVLILTDTMNFDVGVPGLTVSLRGNVCLELEVGALEFAKHSGFFGGPVPDPAQGLAKLIASMTDDEGRLIVDGFPRDLPQSEPLPMDESLFAKQATMLEGVKFLKGPHPLRQTWNLPSLTVTNSAVSTRKNLSNTLHASAWSRISVRVPPGMDGKTARDALVKHLKDHTPWGLKLEIKEEPVGDPWSTEPQGPAFEAAFAALEKAYGKKVIPVGCGGTIPFVKPFADALKGAPALLVGVEDPYTNAHGENESVCLDDLKKACVGEIYLFQEIAARYKGRKES